jgi:hypothetical protein
MTRSREEESEHLETIPYIFGALHTIAIILLFPHPAKKNTKTIF